MTWQAKVRTSTGDLLAFGYTDFTSDGSFDPATESIVMSYELGLVARSTTIVQPHHRWGGAGWVLIELDLFQVKKNKIDVLANETTSRLRSSYPVDSVDSLNVILDDAVEQGLPNRAAHVRSKNAWGVEVLQFYADQRSTIGALTTFADVYAYTWDFSSIMEVDPMITISSALAIVN